MNEELKKNWKMEAEKNRHIFRLRSAIVWIVSGTWPHREQNRDAAFKSQRTARTQIGTAGEMKR